MQTLLTVVHITTCLLLVVVVLIQSGKGAEISASFGGSSQTVFGSSGGENFFTKFTFGLAALFMITSVLLTIAGSRAKKSVFDGLPSAAQTQTAPANNAPADTAAKPADAAAAAVPAEAKK
jgi:preprotein translocase subunit SecG